MSEEHRNLRVLVTGCAGFIGSHLSERLLADGHEVVGVDCFTDYYARAIKQSNLERLAADPRFKLHEIDLSSAPLDGLLEGIDVVYHLAAQAGVRGSFGDGFEHYVRNNIQATQRLLEQAVADPVEAFVYASSSSVYGEAKTYPTAEDHPRAPISPYGMTKVATEDLAAVYHRNSGVPVVGLRYFTAYGPRQRPDMAFHRFMRKALAAEPITILGDGRQLRDFTYVGDLVEATVAASTRGLPGTVYNIGGGTPVELLKVLDVLEQLLERRIATQFLPAAAGDPRHTCAESARAATHLGVVPLTPLNEGLAAQFEWMVTRSRLSPRAPLVIQPPRGGLLSDRTTAAA